MPYRANVFFCYKPNSRMLLLARQFTAALSYPSHTPLGLRNVSPQVLSYYVWWGQCASSCCLNPRCQEGRQGSLRAELWWDYKPFDLARFSVVPCFLSHSIILYCTYPVQVALSTKGLVRSSTNKFKYGGLSAFVRVLHNKGISGNCCGFEDWWPNAVVTMKFRPKKL